MNLNERTLWARPFTLISSIEMKREQVKPPRLLGSHRLVWYIPPPIRFWTGRELSVYEKAGKSCSESITQLSLSEILIHTSIRIPPIFKKNLKALLFLSLETYLSNVALVPAYSSVFVLSSNRRNPLRIQTNSPPPTGCLIRMLSSTREDCFISATNLEPVMLVSW